MVRAYWRDVHKRALSETAQALGLDSRLKVAISGGAITVVLACLFFWGSADASRDELIGRLAIAGVFFLLFPVVYAWKIVSLPVRIQEEEHKALATKVVELHAELKAANDQVANGLVIVGSVESVDIDNGYGLEWQLLVENTASVPIEYQGITIQVSLDGSAPVPRLTRGKVLGRTTAATYKFPFQGEYEPRQGELIVDLTVDYGLVGKAASRRLAQKIRVLFRPRGALTYSDSVNVSHYEEGLSASSTA